MIQTEARHHSIHEANLPRPGSAPKRLLAVALLCLFSAAAPALAAEAAGAALTGVVNVNIATPEELQILPGIGEARARAIVAERDQRGGFKTVDELLEVKGIAERMLVRLRPYVSLSGKSTAEALK